MKVEFSVSQIIHGVEYEGTIEGLGADIKYKLSFGVPIDQLDSQTLPENEQERKSLVRKLFNFTVTKSGQCIDLSDELFGFMLEITGKLALEFYNNPQTQDYNNTNTMLGDAIKNKEHSLLGSSGVDVSIGLSVSYNIPKERIPTILL